MTREEMLSLMIQKFGFENEYTIQFAEAMEWLGLVELEALFARGRAEFMLSALEKRAGGRGRDGKGLLFSISWHPATLRLASDCWH